MRDLLRVAALRHLRLKPLRFALTALGVACGVALFVAIQLINQSTLDSFKESVESLSGKATHTVYGAGSGFPEELIDQVREVKGVRHAVAMMQTRATFHDSQGRRRHLVILGLDLLNEAAVRSYQTTDQEVIDDPLVFLNQADSLVVTDGFAREHGLALDSKIGLTTAYGTRSFTVRGMLVPQGPARAFGGALAIMDIDGARATFGKEGLSDRIDIIPWEDVDPAELTARLQQALGPAYRVERPETEVAAHARMVRGYQVVLSLFGLLALFVGLFVVANAVAVRVAERRREIGTLRACGASRATVIGIVFVEALGLGALGGAVGVWAGGRVAALLSESVARTMSAQFAMPVLLRQAALTPRGAAVGFAAGLLAATLAALLPTWRAARIPPLEALRPADDFSRPPRRAGHPLLGLCGLALLGSLPLVARAGEGTAGPLALGLQAAIAVGGLLLAGPALVGLLLAALRAALPRLAPARARTVAQLACDNLLRAGGRTRRNVMGLLVGLLFVVVLANARESFRFTLARWLDRTLGYDVIVTGDRPQATGEGQPLHESLGRELEALPGVRLQEGRGAQAMRFARVPFRGRIIGLKAYDRPLTEDGFRFLASDGPALETGRALFDGSAPAALISRNFALHFGLEPGASLELQTPSGPQRFQIVDRFDDYTSAEGSILIDRATYTRLWKDPLVSGIGLMLESGTDIDAFRRDVDSKVEGASGLRVASNREMRAQADRMIEEVFGYTRAIQLAALLVGLLGLLNTLLVSVLARTRELALLRASGMSRPQLFAMITLEAVVQGVAGAVAASILGIYLAGAWLTHSLSRALGWVVELRLAPESVLVALGCGIAIGLLAGWLPARRATRMPIAQALVQD